MQKDYSDNEQAQKMALLLTATTIALLKEMVFGEQMHTYAYTYTHTQQLARKMQR